MTDKPDCFAIAQPHVTALAVALQEQHGLTLDQIANVLMSGGVALAVGISGKEGTVLALGAIARLVEEGRYDGAAKVGTNPLN